MPLSLSLSLFSSSLESQHLGLPSFVIGAGTVGVVLSAGEDSLPQVMCWPHRYSVWHLLALITASLNFTPGIGIGEGRGCGCGQTLDVHATWALPFCRASAGGHCGRCAAHSESCYQGDRA